MNNNNFFSEKCIDCISKCSQMKVIVILAVFLLISIVLLNLPLAYILAYIFEPTLTIRTEISEFGNYTGSGADEFTQAYIGSFFPERIEDSFSNVKYSFKAGGNNTYSFEAFLEFSIVDTEEFMDFTDGIAVKNAWEPFSFDNNYKAIVLDNGLDISEGVIKNPESEYYHPIECAKIRMILIREDTQTIIFWALGVYDGGGIGTNFLNAFFVRFKIDPVVYEQSADSPYGQSPYIFD